MHIKMKIISPIALDMGAKYTGVYLPQYPAGTSLESAYIESAVVMHTDKIEYSQATRTAKRHHSRTSKRRKLAKRLFGLVMKHHYQVPFSSLTKIQQDAMNSLLNRRGFTYLSEDVDEHTLINAPTSLFLSLLEGLPDQENLLEVYLKLTESLSDSNQFLAQKAFSLSDKELKEAISEENQDQIDTIKQGIKKLKEGLTNYIKSERDGHKQRKVYFENIKQDILNHRDYLFLRELINDLTGFIRVVGHISNLQHRVLRKYFNDEQMKTGDLWLPEKLHKVFYRNITAMHYKDHNKKDQKTLLRVREQPIMDTFETLEPEVSIPPFEDQNNRRPPKCQSLLIDEKAMVKALPLWWSIIPPLADKIESQGLSVLGGKLLDYNDPKTAAACLQRILELSYAHDPFLFRRWIKNPDLVSHKYNAAIASFKFVVPEQHHKCFIRFAQKFYQETALARSALWFSDKSDSQILKVCNSKTPHKANQLQALLSGALNHELTYQQFKDFQDLWSKNPKIKGNTRLRGICSKAAEAQKEEGNALNEIIRHNQWLVKQGKKPDKKALLTLKDNSEIAATHIGEALGINAKRFANLFDLAKIHNLLENDPKGFSKNCKHCTQEQTWRSQIQANKEGKEAALGLRLPADTTRPFDGYLARMLDRQAYEIAKLKTSQLASIEKNEDILIPILLEENQFRFTLALKEIKKTLSNTDKKKLNKKIEAKETGWLDKNERIKSASQNVCPYTGENLSAAGDIDHIVSRSESRGKNQGVFNHEANLIYCSTLGNTIKNNRIYYLNDLHDNYLRVQFNTTDKKQIQHWLEKNCAPFIAQNELISFTELNQDEQKAIRHGLFIAELRPQLIQLLNQSTKTKVNGTQAYFAKCLMQKIKQLNPDKTIHFDVHYIDASLTSMLRQQLADHDNKFVKQQPQPIASHMIDAAMVIAAASQQPYCSETLQTIGLNSGEWLTSLIPKSMPIVRIERKPKYDKKTISSQSIFKEGLIGEHFVPVIITQDALGFGFDNKNIAWVKDEKTADQYWNLLTEYIGIQQTRDEIKPQNGFKAFPIIKDKAFALFHKIAKEKTSETERQQAELLNGLLYKTRKIKLKEALYSDSKYKAKDKIIGENDFKITLNIKKISTKKLVYPARYEWQKVLENESVIHNAGIKKAFDEKAYQEMVGHLFEDKINHQRQHKKVRKEWSLPIIAKASGGYRAKRKTADGEIIWQMLEVDVSGFEGFKRQGEKIDFNKNHAVPIKAMAESKNLSSISEIWSDEKYETEFFSNYRNIKVPACLNKMVESIGFYLNSKSRFRVRIQFNQQQFSDHVVPLLQESDQQIAHWVDLKAELKVVNPEKWKAIFFNKIGQPRSNLFIYRVGELIDIEYLVLGNNADMKKAYQEGTPLN